MAVQKVVIEIVGDTKGIDSTIKQLEKVGKVDRKNAKSFKQTSGAMSKGFDQLKTKALALGATMLGAFAIQQVVGNAIGIIKDFEKEMSTLQSITGSTQKEMEFFKQASIDVGKATKTSATEVVKAFTLIGSAQPELLKNSKALAEVTKQALILGKAAGIDAASAATALTSAMNQYGASAKDAAKFADIFATSQQKGSSFIAATSEALRNTGAAASAAGLSFETTNAALQALAKGALVGSEAGTALRGVLIKLSSQADNSINPSMVGLGSTIEELAKRNLSLADATKLVGQEGATGLLTLIKQKDIFFELDGALNEVGNAMAQMETNTDNLDGSLDELSNAWEGFILSLDSGDGVISGIIKGIVSMGAALLEIVTPAGEAKEATIDLFNENTKFIGKAVKLKDEYVALASKTNLSAKETQKLSDVTSDLSDMFGESIIQIDKETGALRLNLEEVIRQISIKQALQSDSAKELIADRLRATTKIAAANREREFIELLKKRKDLHPAVTRELYKEAQGFVALTQAQADAEESLKDLEAADQKMLDTVRKSKGVILAEVFAKADLKRINEALLESGIDLTAMAEAQAAGMDNAADATKELTKEEKRQIAAKQKLIDAFNQLEVRLIHDIDELEIAAIKDRQEREKAARVFEFEQKINALKGESDFEAELEKKLREQLRKELAAIDKKYDDAEKAENKKKNDDEKQDEEDLADYKIAQRQRAADAVASISSATLGLFVALKDRKIQLLDNETTVAIRNLQEQRDQNIITEEDFQLRRDAIEKEADNKRKKLLRERAEAHKTAAIIEAIINTAVAVTKAAPVVPLMALVAALGALEIATIIAQPIPEFHEGKKPELKDGEMFAKVLKSESVIPPEQSKKYKGAIDSMIDKNFEKYVFQEYMLPMMKGLSNKADTTAYDDILIWNNQKKQIKLMQENNTLSRTLIKSMELGNRWRSWR